MPAETHVEGEPMERNDVVTLVKDRLAEILEIEPSEINEAMPSPRILMPTRSP